MIKEIRSKINNELLHIFYSSQEAARTNICRDEEILQVAEINLPTNKTFKAHKHLPTIKTTVGVAESWVVLSGCVEVFYYDLDDTLLCIEVLGPGDLSITFQAGHNYRAVTASKVYEFKSGPYLGIEKDKVFIGEC